MAKADFVFRKSYEKKLIFYSGLQKKSLCKIGYIGPKTSENLALKIGL